MTTNKLITPGALFTDPTFDFDARVALGTASQGIGDAGLVFATLDRIDDGEPRSWFEAWSATASSLAQIGADAAAGGHFRHAQWAYLTASFYYATALGAVDGLPDDSALMPTFTEQQRLWDAYIDASEDRYVRVDVPYEHTTLPGYLLRPDSSGAPRPTLVMTNGSDGSLAVMLAFGAAEALARGWNAFVYDGPGQQSTLFLHDMTFRPDWEAVLTPVIDALVARSDVDPDALTGYGASQGGYWLPRALAFEHRFVAAVADPGVVDVAASWNHLLPPELLDLLQSGQKDTFNAILQKVDATPQAARTFAFRSRPFGTSDPFDVFTAVQQYQLRDLTAQIRTPLFITAPEDEQFWPGQSQQLSDLLPAVTHLVPFTREQGANMHCQPLGRQLTHHAAFDWLADHLADSNQKQQSAPSGA